VEVLILQVFVSLVLVTGSLLLFCQSVRRRDYEHADRLALFPVADDDARPKPVPPSPPPPPAPAAAAAAAAAADRES
jgi:hypothetical protein